MITVEIIAVGKIREKFFSDALSEYQKRLGRYCNFKIVQVADFPDDKSECEKEAELILPKIKGYCIPLCIEGKKFSSEDFAKHISEIQTRGVSHITFIIGGSRGLDKSVKEKGDLLLSFSDMTFPHQLMRVVLTEQIYRAFKIINNENYHK